uniref:Uncharacterized protein n=1 Tax=Rhinopithecus bieti TaxID=61621 RepID=A0A2K6MYP1_RHIBE
AQGAVPGPGRAAARQKLSLRREKARSLAQVVGGTIDLQVFKTLVDLLKLKMMLKSMCAWQRLASEPQAVFQMLTSSVPETLRRNKGSTSLRGAVALLECSGRKGSSQGTPCQPSATRLPTWGRPGKSPMRGST